MRIPSPGRRSFGLLLTLALTTSCFAQPVAAPGTPKALGVFAPTFLPVSHPADAVVAVTPDRSDWTYPLGVTASFRITVAVTPYPAAGVPIKYKLGPENREAAEKDALVPAAGLVLSVPSPSGPGFIRCIVTATVAEKSIREVATVGFSPEKIVPTQTEPADFDKFWAEQKAALAKVPADYQLTPAPELSNAKVEVSYVSYQNISGGAIPSRFYGVLCVPRGPGPFPALLAVPGAGVRGYTGLRGLAEKGVITLQVGIHGIPVNLPAVVYDQLKNGALDGYPRYNLDNRSNYYYRRVYMGCLRGNDYLTSLPQWDGKNLIVMGGSQGGQLTIVTSALDPRVTGLAASYPAYSDVTGYLLGRTGGWPGLFRLGHDGKSSEPALEEKVLTTSYYDTVNFARRLKVPGFYFWGYNDATCPPTSTFSAYNVITAPKQLTIAVEQEHKTSPDQQARIEAWVLGQVGR